MSSKRFVLGCVGAIAIAVLWVTATYTPTLDSDLHTTTSAPEEIRVAARTVQGFLERSGYLPTVGTGLLRRNNQIEWANLPNSSMPISAVTILKVRLVSGSPLLMSMLDDDPTYHAEVDAKIVTTDGHSTRLRVTLWDYGRVTPWSIEAHGDGWKPIAAIWQ